MDVSKLSKELEEVVILELRDDIIGGISPREVGNLMMDRKLLLVGEFEELVIMRTKNSPDAEQSNFLLSCLNKRSAGSFQTFREILIQTGATHLEEIIKSKIKDISTGTSSYVKEVWKKKFQELEIEMQHKDEEIKKLQSQVEDMKFRDEEIKRLRSQIENLTGCITSFQNTVKPHIMYPILRDKLSKTYHPASQRSSWDKDSPRTTWYKETDSPRSSWHELGKYTVGRDDSPSPAMGNETSQSSDRPIKPIDEENSIDEGKTSVNLLHSTAISTHHSAPPSSLSSPSSHANLKPGGPSWAFRRRSPTKDLGLQLMQKMKKQIEDSENA